MGTSTEIVVLAGSVSSAFFIFALNRGLKMKEEGRPLAELLWYSGGLVPLAAVALVWASMGDQPVTFQRVALFTIGALIGGFALLAAGELIRPVTPVSAQSTSVPLGGGTGSSTNQQGGITGGIINIYPPQQLPTNHRNIRLNQLRQLWISSHDGITPEMLAGFEWPPEEWMNRELEKLNEDFRVRVAGDKVTFVTPPAK